MIKEPIKIKAASLYGVFDYPDLFNLEIPTHEIEFWHNDSIRTYSGIYMNVFEPTPEMVYIGDIAHALSNSCRFGGHVPRFYSVAQHAVMASYYVEDPRDAYDALHHDDSEAYLLDVPTPIKRKLVGYKEIESNLMEVISKVLNFNWPLSEGVKRVDAAMLKFEWDYLIHKKELPSWVHPQFGVWTSEEAEVKYLKRHYELLEMMK